MSASSQQGEVSLTPVRVRGKRRRNDENHDRPSKRRPTALQRSRNGGKSSISLPKRQQKDRTLSLLESLPVELIQIIFRYSLNPDLPLTSRHLADALARTQHLQKHFTTALVLPLLDKQKKPVEDSVLRPAMRLLESRFMTYSFFRDWLRPEWAATRKRHEDIRPVGPQFWPLHQPAPNLLPPKKLFRSPVTPDKARFLRMFSGYLISTRNRHPIIAELARDGLVAAIRDNSAMAVEALVWMGWYPDDEMLRLAVIESGCHRAVLNSLINRAVIRAGPEVPTPFLDAQLWSWADQATSREDSKGEWLRERLRLAETSRNDWIRKWSGDGTSSSQPNEV